MWDERAEMPLGPDDHDGYRCEMYRKTTAETKPDQWARLLLMLGPASKFEMQDVTGKPNFGGRSSRGELDDPWASWAFGSADHPLATNLALGRQS